MKKVLVTGSGGLIGSEACSYYSNEGWEVWGIDNDERGVTLGHDGSTSRVSIEQIHRLKNFDHRSYDIRDRKLMLDLVKDRQPALIIHTAAQPSHDLAGKWPLHSWDVNATGTVNLLEAMRLHSPECVFAFLSSSKVYGDRVNGLSYDEEETRYQPSYDNYGYQFSIDEEFNIDQSMHSLLGSTKIAADLMVQEYGRYYGLKTVCLRCGCLTGGNHQAVEQHGFLAYLVKCLVTGKPYTIYGYKGKQVRDNIHAYDVIRFIDEFFQNPKCGEVYNIGGGFQNSLSIIEATQFLGYNLLPSFELPHYVDKPRKGDHIWYISNLTKALRDYPKWRVSRSLDHILKELVEVNSTGNKTEPATKA